MIQITMPPLSTTITRREQELKEGDPVIAPVAGFIDLHQIPRDKGGVIFFYDRSGQCLLVGKARKLRQRVKKHLEDNVSPLKNRRDDVYKISVAVVEDAVEREIYETYFINELKAVCNIDKAYHNS